jgi:hypothetical protein
VFLGLVLAAVGVAYLDGSTAQAPVAPGVFGAASAPSCPIPVGRQVKAVKAFRKMMPVFRHPRCLNCHGGVDPLSEAHRGVDQLDPEIDRMANREEFEEQCQACHDQMPGLVQGWTTPGEPVFFVGKDDEELCLQMKRFERTGEDFVEHLDNDHFGIQFIAAGFVGDRALGDGLGDYELVPEPPPGTQADLVAQAEKWVDLLGDGYTASPECGCVMPKLKLQIHHRAMDDPNHSTSRAGQIGFGGELRFEVDLTPIEMDSRYQGPLLWYRGAKSLVRQLQVSHARADCSGTASEREDWEFSAELDQESNQMKLHFGFTTSEERGTSVCKVGGSMDLDPSIFSDLRELVVPLDSGATAQASAKELDGRGRGQEWLTVKVLENQQ